MQIKPTIGRVVWYYRSLAEKQEGRQPNAALVAYVHSDSCVNLAVFDQNGVPHPQTSVRLMQDGETDHPEWGFCEWMPYQIGQAKAQNTPASA